MRIEWRLVELLAKYNIRAKELGKELGLAYSTVKKLKKAENLPSIGSEKICAIAKALTNLSGEKITALDLIKYSEE